MKFANRPNVVITQVHDPVPEAIIEPNIDNLSSRSNGVQKEANPQPVSDSRYLWG